MDKQCSPLKPYYNPPFAMTWLHYQSPPRQVDTPSAEREMSTFTQDPPPHLQDPASKTTSC